MQMHGMCMVVGELNVVPSPSTDRPVPHAVLNSRPIAERRIQLKLYLLQVASSTYMQSCRYIHIRRRMCTTTLQVRIKLGSIQLSSRGKCCTRILL